MPLVIQNQEARRLNKQLCIQKLTGERERFKKKVETEKFIHNSAQKIPTWRGMYLSVYEEVYKKHSTPKIFGIKKSLSKLNISPGYLTSISVHKADSWLPGCIHAGAMRPAECTIE